LITNNSIKSLDHCDIVKYWANTIEIMRILKREEDLYLDELFLIACIYRITVNKGRGAKYNEIEKGFNIMSYKRKYMLENITKRGFIKNDAEGLKNGSGMVYKIVLTPLGEQILNKYRKLLVKLIEGS
jgi:predicted DNA-binding transcriptional regulator